MRKLKTGQETELYQVPEGLTFGDGLAVSPDGRRLAFLIPSMRKQTPTLILMTRPTGDGEPRQLLEVEDPDRLADHLLAWTPDGRHILFGKQRRTEPVQVGRTELWRIPADGGEPEKLGEIEGEARDLRVHPDGRQIAFTARKSVRELWVIENLLPTPEKPR